RRSSPCCSCRSAGGGPSGRPVRSECLSCLTGRQCGDILGKEAVARDERTCEGYSDSTPGELSMIKRSLIGALAGAAALALTASGAAAQQKLKVGFIYVGPVGDHGWSYQHDVGRKAIEKELGDKVETTFVESVPEADSERAIEQLARTGHGL